MKKEIMHFATFADGNLDLKKAGLRLKKQAEDTKLFKSVNLFDLNFIDQIESPLSRSFYHSNPRGFGYWTWKPQLLNHVLGSIPNEGELLIYSDAGTEIVNNFLTRRRFQRFLIETKHQPILAFNTSVPEYKFTKNKCLSLLDSEGSKYTNQIAATTIIIKNCDKSREFIGQWAQIATSSAGSYSNDELGNEVPGFIEHRHDQSIFSVLYKNSKFKSYKVSNPRYATKPAHVNLVDKIFCNHLFFWQIRNKSGESCVSSWQRSSILSFIILPSSLISPIFYVMGQIIAKFRYKLTKSFKN
jgi:hypothetical protein